MKATPTTWFILAIVGALAIVAAWIFLGGNSSSTDTKPSGATPTSPAGGTPVPADSIRRHADDPLSQSIRTLRQQYHLSTAARLDALCRTADQQTQLTDEQRQRISAVNETISRRADDALREVRAEQANLKARAASLGSGAAADATQAAEIRRQLMDLVARELQIAGELDRQYMEMMSRELTPEQMRVLTGQPKPEDEPEVRPPPVQWIPPEEAEALRQHPAASDNE